MCKQSDSQQGSMLWQECMVVEFIVKTNLSTILANSSAGYFISTELTASNRHNDCLLLESSGGVTKQILSLSLSLSPPPPLFKCQFLCILSTLNMLLLYFSSRLDRAASEFISLSLSPFFFFFPPFKNCFLLKGTRVT